MRAGLIVATLMGALMTAQTAQAQVSGATGTKPAAIAGASLFLIRYRPGPGYRHGTPLLRQDLREHGAYLGDLARRGVVLAAGPTMLEEGGLVLLRAADVEAVRKVAQDDPAVRSGVFVGEVSDWRPMIDPGGMFSAADPVDPARGLQEPEGHGGGDLGR
jgi:uncharacterized protein YciI